MNILKVQSELHKKLLSACEQSITRITEKFENKIYAFVLFPSSGFRDFGLALSTRESMDELINRNKDIGDFDEALLLALQDHPDLLAKAQENHISSDYYEVTASEWKYISIYTDLFEDINDYIFSYYDQFYDSGFEPHQIYELFETIIIDVFYCLESFGKFNNAIFEDDILKGVQFPDNANIYLMKSVSKKVNSTKWHEKLCKVCDE